MELKYTLDMVNWSKKHPEIMNFRNTYGINLHTEIN